MLAGGIATSLDQSRFETAVARRPASDQRRHQMSDATLYGAISECLTTRDDVMHGLFAWRTPDAAVSKAGKIEAGE